MRGGGTRRTGRDPGARPLAYKLPAIGAALADLGRLADLRAATRSRAEAVKQHAERRGCSGKRGPRGGAARPRARLRRRRDGPTTPGSGGVSGGSSPIPTGT